MTESSLFQRFFRWNRRISRGLLTLLPQGPTVAFKEYEEVIEKYLSKLEQPVILDVGGGAECSFNAFRPPGSHLICLDISAEQLERNKDADQRVLADATKEIPLPDESVDLLVSRAVLEHLASPGDFVKHSRRVLKPGGYAIHVFPCKFALFALINQLLPTTLSNKVLFYFQPEALGKSGFPAYYRDCYYSKIKQIYLENGFVLKEIYDYHSQSWYFDFFLPLFLISAGYEIMTLPVKNLASYLLTVIQKPVTTRIMGN